jgi:regulator of protease activity HflC (stomatin/prohibitin superfamily)
MSFALLGVIAIVVVALFAILFKAIVVVPQASAAVVERLGRYRATLLPGLNFLVPFLDRIRDRIDLREQVVSFPPQPVITKDNLTISIDLVVYFRVTNPKDAVYEISNYIAGAEQLAITTLSNVVGGMSMEDTLSSRDFINSQLAGVLDEAAIRWGLRIGRVELKAIDPPASVQDSIEKRMRVDQEKRAAILAAEGQKQAQIIAAEGSKQVAILTAEAERESRIMRAQGERAAAEAERQARIIRAQGERAVQYLQSQRRSDPAREPEQVHKAVDVRPEP